jgi:hypothetical protein
VIKEKMIRIEKAISSNIDSDGILDIGIDYRMSRASLQRKEKKL